MNNNIDFQNGFLCGLSLRLNLVSKSNSDILTEYWFTEQIDNLNLNVRDNVRDVDYLSISKTSDFAEDINLSKFMFSLTDNFIHEFK